MRSRLKKWRVTKPSRQTRKKPQGSDDEFEKDGRSSTASPRNQKQSPILRDSAKHPEWAHPLYAPQHNIVSQQLTPSPSGDGLIRDHSSTVHSFSDPSPSTSSFEHPGQTSTTAGLMVNTSSVVTPTYSTLPLSPESCIPSPGTTTAQMAQWPPRAVSLDLGLNQAMHPPAPWYSVPFEPVTPPSSVPHTAPLPASASGYMIPPTHGIYPPEFTHYSGEDYQIYDSKPWKRTMSLQYDYGQNRHGHGHPEHPEHHDRKYHSTYHHPHGDMVSLPASQPVMCAPMMPYSS